MTERKSHAQIQLEIVQEYAQRMHKKVADEDELGTALMSMTSFYGRKSDYYAGNSEFVDFDGLYVAISLLQDALCHLAMYLDHVVDGEDMQSRQRAFDACLTALERCISC